MGIPEFPFPASTMTKTTAYLTTTCVPCPATAYVLKRYVLCAYVLVYIWNVLLYLCLYLAAAYNPRAVSPYFYLVLSSDPQYFQSLSVRCYSLYIRALYNIRL